MEPHKCTEKFLCMSSTPARMTESGASTLKEHLMTSCKSDDMAVQRTPKIGGESCEMRRRLSSRSDVKLGRTEQMDPGRNEKGESAKKFGGFPWIVPMKHDGALKRKLVEEYDSEYSDEGNTCTGTEPLTSKHINEQACVA